MNGKRQRVALRMAVAALVVLVLVAISGYVEAWPALKPRPEVMQRNLAVFAAACVLLFASIFMLAPMPGLSTLLSRPATTLQRVALVFSVLDVGWIAKFLGTGLAVAAYLLAFLAAFVLAWLLRRILADAEGA